MTTPLYDQYQRLTADQPRLHARDAARALNATEAELVASLPGARWLAPRFQETVRRFGALGEVKTLTRNESAVIERWGRFESIEVDDSPVGGVVGEEIDLRIFFRQWRTGFLLEETGRNGERVSLQFFDQAGDSVHKIYAETEAGVAQMRRIAEDLASDAQELTPFQAPSAKERPAASSTIDLEAFHAAWDAMRNTHEFHGLLRSFGLARVPALELAGRERAREVATTSFETILRTAARDEEPIMIFVGSRGVLQIHTGRVHRIERMAGYLNVLDPRFNLHVRDDRIRRTFVVKKPTDDGIVTSVELFDEDDETIAMLFSKRKPGQIEGSWWRSLVDSIPGPTP